MQTLKLHRDPTPVPVAPPGTPVYTDVSKLRALAYSAIALDRLDDAREVLERALAQSPNDIEIVGDLASLALRQGDADAAVRLARCGLRLDPGHLSCHVAMALGLVALGDADTALAALLALRDGEHADRLRAEQPAMAALIAAELGRLESGGVVAAPGTPVRTLPLAARFDILVKLLYVLHRRGELPAWVTVDVPAMYARHLQLRGDDTTGADPLATRVARFDALIDDMGVRGYDASQPVRLSAIDGLPCDGAHRMAAALALGLPVAIDSVPARGARWDLAWFQQHGFGAEACNVLLRTWVRLRGEAACIGLLWAPTETCWPQLEASLAGEMDLVGTRTIELPRTAFEELVRDVHAGGPMSAAAIEHRVELLRAWPAKLRVVWCERRDDAQALPPGQLVQALHAGLDAVVPAAWGVTVHLAEGPDENRQLMDIVASEHNLAMLRERGPLAPTLSRQLVALRQAMRANGLSPDAVCVVGDGVLAALGLAEAPGLEIAVRREARPAAAGAGPQALGPGVSLAPEGHARRFGTEPPPDDDRLLADPDLHFRVRGIRFASAAVLLERLQHDRDPRCLSELALRADRAGPAR